MAGLLCLQGGRELTPPCEEMDAEVLERVDGPVAVLAGAARPGSDYAGASGRARRHYEGLGAAVVIVPDPREGQAPALDALDGVAMVVLPGGSPGGLLDVLTGPVGERLVELHRSGVLLSGASAGAMVLCARTALPDRGGTTGAGLGLVPGLALPHWSPGSDRRWSVGDGLLWGLPECGGVLVDGDDVSAVGQGRASVRTGDVWRELPRRPMSSMSELIGT
ncbi:MAG: Type 1 glutamine amidotransferase-like domain-containing protein [Actinomycetota bacterium]